MLNVVRTVLASRIVQYCQVTGFLSLLQYFTGTYQNKIMIQNQEKSEERKKLGVLYSEKNK